MSGHELLATSVPSVSQEHYRYGCARVLIMTDVCHATRSMISDVSSLVCTRVEVNDGRRCKRILS